MRRIIQPYWGCIVIIIVLAAFGLIQYGIKVAADHTRTHHAGICQPEKLIRGQRGITLRVNCDGTRGYVRSLGRTHDRIILRFAAGKRDPLRCEISRDTTASCEPIARRHGS